MTAFRLTPVGPEGPERDRSQHIRLTPCSELHAENVRLRGALAEETNLRISFQVRLSRSMRVLASLGRLSPRMAGVVAAAGREIWQLDRADRRRQSKATRKARVEVYGRLP